MKTIGRPVIHDISLGQLLSCSGMSRRQAADKFRIDLSALSRAQKRHNVSVLFKKIKNQKIPLEVLLDNDGMNARQYAIKIGYNVNTLYRAIRRCGVHEKYGLSKYHFSLMEV